MSSGSGSGGSSASPVPVLLLRALLARLRKDAACPVCLGALAAAAAPPTPTEQRLFCSLLECGHSLCAACTSEIIKRGETCPICSKKFSRRRLVSNVDVAPNRLAAAVALLVEAFDKSLPDGARATSTSHPHPGNEKANAPLDGVIRIAHVVVQDNHPMCTVFSDGAAPCRDRPIGTNEHAAVSAPPPSSDPSSNPTCADKDSLPYVSYAPGDVVKVLPRLWPGMNRPGGVATIINVDSASDGTVDVKYLLDGTRDLCVPRAFVVPSEELTMSRVQRRQRQSAAHIHESSAAAESKAIRSPPPGSDSASKRVYEAASSVRIVTGRKRDSRCQQTGCSPLCILTSHMDDGQMESVASFAETFGADLRTSFSREVTHLIVDAGSTCVDGGGRILHQRTMKYLKCLAGGKWIVSFDWIKACLRSSKIEAESPFEILMDAKSATPGAPSVWRRIRCSQLSRVTDHNPTSLPRCPVVEVPFRGVCAVLSGSFPSPGPPKEDLAELLHLGGASLVLMLPAYNETNLTSTRMLAASFAEHMEVLESHPIYIVSSDRSGADAFVSLDRVASAAHGEEGHGARIAAMSVADRAQFVSPLWVLDCISNCRRLDAGDKLYAV